MQGRSSIDHQVNLSYYEFARGLDWGPDWWFGYQVTIVTQQYNSIPGQAQSQLS